MPGIEVPEALIREVAAAADTAAASVAIAARTIAAVQPLCHGVHLMALGREAWIPTIMAQAGLAPRPKTDTGSQHLSETV